MSEIEYSLSNQLDELWCLTRWEIINHIIKKYDFERYLEIGISNPRWCYNMVSCRDKDGVDPGYEFENNVANYKMTSDEFFDLIKDHPEIQYDVIFIDGLHHADQVDKDIENSLKHLVPNGYIVLHDCNPISYDAQKIPRETVVWNGDVWKSIVKLRCSEPNLEVTVVDTDWGVGVVRKGSQEIYNKTSLEECLIWDYFDKHRVELNNLITVEDFYNKY